MKCVNQVFCIFCKHTTAIKSNVFLIILSYLMLNGSLLAAGSDGSSGFVLKGVDEFDSSGISVSGVGDLNGDGIDDLIIGARDADPNGKYRAGRSYVVFGRTSGFPAAFELTSRWPAAGGVGIAHVPAAV